MCEFLGDTRFILGATQSEMVKMEQMQNDLASRSSD